MEKQDGISLVEVIASLLLISIILLSFYPLFITTKNISNSNIERLVAVNLADATLDRLKMDPYSYIDNPTTDPAYLFKNVKSKLYNRTNCPAPTFCLDIYSIKLNERNYEIEVKASQEKSEESVIKLINIVVTAKNERGNINYSVEGYVSYE